MNVALVSVGDELLSGDTVNTNAAWLGECLTERGADVERATTVPDREADIARVVNEYAAEYDAVITTGGLGPTHDDRTIEGVAAAVGREVETNETALEWLATEGGYQHEDLAEGTAELPVGARPLHNTEGVAPGCVIENVYVLPGVPEEMKAMFERVEDDFEGETRHVAFVVVDEPESALISRFEELQERFDVTVGSYPGDHVRVKIQSPDEDAVDEAAAWLHENADVL
ncbi:competence/damage-inducible protein A [Natronomonas halophila]|uniref:competence/damage-inducible protein A n=1 Tax=Natronomonas halophila TaxID=2747817 RepID=UPI0015B4CD1F|nr:molybdopterin-binding protein [Natronomonas halophila]QLD85194.1 competence/damage-inducible protein A [Natronomonas halophila]